MKQSIRWSLVTVIVAASAFGAAGCQTYQVGQVLPSPYHMRDDVTYFPKGPQFPLVNELNAMQAAEEEARPR